MLVIDRARDVCREIRRTPMLTRIGLSLMLAAFVADVVLHTAAVPHEHAGHRPEEHLAHLAGLLGMILVLAGIVLDGARHHRPRRRSSDAHR